MSLCIIFLGMKDDERFWTSKYKQGIWFLVRFHSFVVEEVGLCHAGCRCNPAAFWSQISTAALCDDVDWGTFLSCRPRLQITRSTAVCSRDFISTPLEILHHQIWNLMYILYSPTFSCDLLIFILGIDGNFCSQLQVLGSSTLPLFWWLQASLNFPSQRILSSHVENLFAVLVL